MYYTEAERMFFEEVREKKRTASGVHSKTGKNGYVGTMRFPSDIMSRKDKLKYRRASKVMTSNLYDEIMVIDEFNALETNEQKNRMQYWRLNNSIKDIQKAMGISNKRYYDIVQELELPVAPRGGSKKRSGTTGTTTKGKKKQQELALKEETKQVDQEQATVQEIVVDGMHLVFSGTYSPEQIQKQLSKFELLLEGETDKFFVELRLIQKAKK